MKIEKLNGKTLAECKGIEISKRMNFSKENNYPYIRIKEKDSDEKIVVMLSRGLAADLKGTGNIYPPRESVFYVYVDQESGEERIRLGRPTEEFMDASTTPAWG
jgi:hypothetical protein